MREFRAARKRIRFVVIVAKDCRPLLNTRILESAGWRACDEFRQNQPNSQEYSDCGNVTMSDERSPGQRPDSYQPRASDSESAALGCAPNPEKERFTAEPLRPTATNGPPKPASLNSA